MATALATLMSMPSVSLAPHATPIDELTRLTEALGAASPRVFMKRDDLLSFGLGGNKVRKMQTVAAEARGAGADTLITAGGLQSNHARVTAATGAALGCRVILVLNGVAEPPLRANAKLDELFGAEIRTVTSREERDATMVAAADEVRAAGGKPWVVPIGASNPTGALGFARGLEEVTAAGLRPDVIVHASSSAGTQAGLIAGCALFGLRPRILGVSSDEPAASLAANVEHLLAGMADRLGAKLASISGDRAPEVDERQVGDGYGISTPASTEALELVARREGVLLDPVYTAKAMAGLIARVRAGEFSPETTVLFWHTGGQIGYFA